MGISQFIADRKPGDRPASYPGGCRNTPSCFTFQKLEISAGLMGHLARLQTLLLTND